MNDFLTSAHVVVTGAAGFIGSHVVERLGTLGYSNVTVVAKAPSKDDPRREYFDNLKYKELIGPEKFLELLNEESFQKPDVVIHLGARTDTAEKDKNLLFQKNTHYTQELFKYCVKDNVRFIYASSIATYGDGESGFLESETKLNPENPYALSKQNADEFILNSTNKPPQWIGLKFTNVYGPRESFKGRMATMVYHGHKQITESGEITLFKSHKKEYKDGEQSRDYIYVKDVVDVILFFLSHADVSGIFNVGSGESRTFLELSRILFKELNVESRIKFKDIPEDIRKSYQYFTKADISRLRSYGYTKKMHTLEEGVRDYVRSYLSKLKINKEC
jgi:ADP-L-glycero-D-manno-heptose 6-epimerase